MAADRYRLIEFANAVRLLNDATLAIKVMVVRNQGGQELEDLLRRGRQLADNVTEHLGELKDAVPSEALLLAKLLTSELESLESDAAEHSGNSPGV